MNSEEETLPPRLPWVLLCHTSRGACGNTWTVNRLEEWRETIRLRWEHEQSCVT